MIWRLWALVCGVPIGLLGGLALDAGGLDAGLVAFVAAAAAGALAMLALASAARRRHRGAARADHLLRATSAGWLALPLALAEWVDVGPGALVWLALALAWVVQAFWRHARGRRRAPGPLRQLLTVAGELCVGVVVALVVGGLWAATDGGPLAPSETVRRASWDVDATVPLDPAPSCAPRARSVAPLAEGSRPRVDEAGEHVWFEAPGPEGRIQVYAVARAGGAAACWTCGEPGNNRHPAPSSDGTAVVFSTDRFASARHPLDTELMVMARPKGARRFVSRRLTHDTAIDDHAGYDPGGHGIYWLRARRGRAVVRRAGIQSGHGGLLLAGEEDLVRAHAGWAVPLAWSPDARALVTARGHGLGPLRGELLDPATGTRAPLGGSLAPGPSASFSRDGSVLALAETATIRAAALLPESVGFLVGRLRTFSRDAAPEITSGTVVRLGAPLGERVAVELGEAAAWGAPTGVALAPDARGFALGQVRADGQERIVWVDLECAD